MRKSLYTALLLAGFVTSVAAPVYALNAVDVIEPKLVAPLDTNTEKQIIDMIKGLTLPDGAMYKQLLAIEPKAIGYALEVPVLELDEEHQVPAYRILLTEESPIRNAKQYKFNLVEPKALLPKIALSAVPKPYSIGKFDFNARIVPSLQLFMQKSLNIQQLKTYNGWSAEKINAEQTVKPVSEELAQMDAKVSVEKAEFSKLPLINFSVKQANLTGRVSSVRMAADEAERYVMSPEGVWNLSIDNAQVLSLFMPFSQVSFDAKAQLTTTTDGDLDALRVDMEGRIFNIQNTPLNDAVQQSMLEKWPEEITFKGAFIDISAVQLTQLLRLTGEIHRTLFVTDDQQEQFTSQLNDFLPPLPLHVEALTIEGKNYAVLAKGVLSEDGFSGTVGIHNFDVISPEKNKTDVTSGLLDVLRPYKSTARKEKDAKGRDMLTFDIQYSYKLGLFINKHKVSQIGAEVPTESEEEVIEFADEEVIETESAADEQATATTPEATEQTEAAAEAQAEPASEVETVQEPEQFNTSLFPDVEM